MKKYLLLIVLVIAGFYASAQESSVMDRFFRKYESDRNFTLINITPKMFNLFTKAAAHDADAQSFVRVVQKLKGLRILVKEKAADAPRLYNEASALLRSDFQELMTIREKKADLKFLIKENKRGHITELIMLISSEEEFLIMSLLGDIDLNEVNQIASNMNIQGMDKLKNVKKK